MDWLRRFPWARACCALGAFGALSSSMDMYGQIKMPEVVLTCGFLFAFVGLQAIATWRDKD